LAGYTYGPLLGLYAFGFFINKGVNDRMIPLVCVAAPLITYILDSYSTTLLWGYKFGFELLILNGLLTFAGMFMVSRSSGKPIQNLLSKYHL
jgi:hypothetical protein